MGQVFTYFQSQYQTEKGETMSIHIQNADDLKAKLIEAGDKIVIIYFSATWCGPCVAIGPEVEEVAKEMADSIVVLKVDVDECGDIAADYKIDELPNFLFMKSDKKLEEFSGCSGGDEIRSTILKYK